MYSNFFFSKEEESREKYEKIRERKKYILLRERPGSNAASDDVID